MRISEIGTLVEIRFFYSILWVTKVVGSMGVGVVYLNGFDMRSLHCFVKENNTGTFV
jgi:hypothetical protein